MTGSEDHDEDDAVLAAEYALGLLDAEAAAACERRLMTDERFRALHAEWADQFASLTSDVDPVMPPARLRSALEQRLFPAARQSLIRRLGLWPALGVAAVVAGLFVVLPQTGLFEPDAVSPTMTAEVAAEDRSLVVQVAFVDGTSELRISRPEGAAAQGRALELWLIAGEEAPVSLGVLPDERQASLAIPADLVPVLQDAVLAISDEPEGGSPTGLPTGDVLALGSVVTL